MEYGLYLHLPYCRSLCPYCAFAKAPLHHAEPGRLVRALAAEWTLAASEAPAAWRAARPRTIFVGGGTPTALDEATLEAFLDWVRAEFPVSSVREWTVEANPEGLGIEKLRLLRSAGVDRLSIGVQSFEPDVLRALGRIHTAEGAARAVERARTAGFENLSVDLMAGVPRETAAGFERGIERVIELGVPHVSLYALQVEEGTPLAVKAARGAIAIPSDDEAAARYDAAALVLARAGYRRYEVSSWARPGHESRHNQAYWIRRPYLGLGPGAHSFDGARRWGNEQDVARWFARVEAGELPRGEMRSLTERDAIEEAVFLGLRRTRGVRRRAIFNAAFRDRKVAETWTRWGEAAGALRRGDRARVRPTEHGLMTALETASELFARADRARPG